jgi:hypothetical protein
MLYKIGKAALFTVVLSWLLSCAPRYGCPSNGKNVGAERLMDGSKVPKARKMRV